MAACFLDGELDGPLLVGFGVFPRLSGERDRTSNPLVNKIPMASFATSVRESGRQEVGYQFTDLTRHH
jgi:hypothetical protein